MNDQCFTLTMSSTLTVTQIRLKNVTTCLAVTVETLQILGASFRTPFLEAISNTTQSLLTSALVNIPNGHEIGESKSIILDCQTKQE
jgi:hypothetical protein